MPKKKYSSYYLGGKRENLVGYCRLHRRCMTRKQMKVRKCLSKQCGAFKKLEHPYWEQNERNKQQRKVVKETGDTSATKQNNTENAAKCPEFAL